MEMDLTGVYKDDLAFLDYLSISTHVQIQGGLVYESEIRVRPEKYFKANGTVYRAIERAWLEQVIHYTESA